MAKQYIIRVSRVVKKTTPTCSVVTCAMNLVYQFQNVYDLLMWLDQCCLAQKDGQLYIKTVRVGSTCLIWSKANNLPLGMSLLEFLEWQNALLREHLND